MGRHTDEEFGHYLLHEMLGRGGMGEVYRAYDTRRDRTVALKRLRLEFASDETFQARFRRESRMAARLNEPHIIPIHDFGEIDGHLYLDMRLVEGIDLGTLLEQHPPPAALTVDLIGQVASALQAAHDSGLVHRDVKPSNVLLTGMDEEQANAFAYLVDFGIARSALGQGGTSLTSSTDTVGTVAYMAPERISGGPGDHRSDIYSLACLFYECLTGQAPFKGEAFQVMFAHVNARPPPPSEVRRELPAALDEVVLRGMAKSPDARFQSASQLASAARAALRQAGMPAPPPPRAAPPPGPPMWQTPPPGPFGPHTPPAPFGPHTPPPPGPYTPPPAPPSRPPTGPPSRPPTGPPTGPQTGPPPGPPGRPPTPPPTGPPPTGPPTPPPAPRSTPPPAGPPTRPVHTTPPPLSPAAPPKPANDRRALVAIAVATVIALAVGIGVVLLTRGGGSPSSDQTGSAGPVTSVSHSPDFPSSPLSQSAPTSVTPGWQQYSAFTDLVGNFEGDTAGAYKGASCRLADADADIEGMVDQIECKNIPGSSVEFFVGRFSSAASVNAYVNKLVSDKKYDKDFWTIGGKRRGLVYTSPDDAGFGDVTSSICAMPTYLVQFFAPDSANITGKQLFDDFWKSAPFPNDTPAECV